MLNMATEQEYCLRWNNHQSTLLTVLGKLLMSESLTDITLACDGRTVKCHKIVLSACSPYFQEILNTVTEEKHIVIYLKDVSFDELQSLVEYMYKGEVNIVQHKLPSLIKTAESLKIRGLSETEDSKKLENKIWVQPPTPPANSDSPLCKKRKLETLQNHQNSLSPMIRVRTFEQALPPLHPIDGKSSIDLDESRLDTKENLLQLPKSEMDFNESDLEAEGEWSDTELNNVVGDELLGPWQSNGCEPGPLDLENVRLRKGRTSDGQFQCPKCGRRYQHKHTMNRHVRYICGLEPQFQCPLCEKKFHVNYRLKEHLKTNHGVESGPSPPTLNPPTTTAAIALQPTGEPTHLYIAEMSSFPSLNVTL